MSSLTMPDKRILEEYLEMAGGYVLDFSDRTFGEFCHEAVHREIHSGCYQIHGTSKAKKLRAFWEVESDYLVGRLLTALIQYVDSMKVSLKKNKDKQSEQCRATANRLLTGGAPSLGELKQHSEALEAKYLAEQIRRMEDSVETDPTLAIGTAKELIETCCKTILFERGVEIKETTDIPTLTKATLKELKLVPEGISNSSRGADVIKRLLSNLGTIGNGLAELRGLYGTGHGKHASSSGLSSRHAKLAVGAASTLAVFLFETHKETLTNP